jgi:phosphate uptake regulator
MKVIERSVQEIGKSLLVTLPKTWANGVGVKKGSVLKMIVGEEGHLSIAPEFVAKEEKRDVIITFDEHFQRRFIREHFNGNHKIIIKFKKITEKQRKKLYSFLTRFINVQIIEETKNRIVAKSFKIDELTLETCLNRMFYLSLNMLDDRTDKVKMNELRDNMTRFYYMLVMQVRVFLSEGKFTGQNQIPLIRAMDIRMVAEKVQRIGEIIASEGTRLGDMKSIRDYYFRAVQYFINSDFEKALPLWQESQALQKKYRNDNAKTQLVFYAKQISMLVR